LNLVHVEDFLLFNPLHKDNLPFSAGIGYPSNQLQPDSFSSFVLMILYAIVVVIALVSARKDHANKLRQRIIPTK
jgi:hypothetical protein